MASLKLTRAQILSFRRREGSLDERLPPGAASLRKAASAGLQDSMPRAALLSIHARVQGTGPSTWEHRTLVQLWGLRHSAYLVAAQDLPVFSLGRLPQDARGLKRAQDTATRLSAFLAGRRMPFGEAGKGMRVHPNSLRYAAPTGTVLLRWEGARQPVIWSVPAPRMDPQQAGQELARRHLHALGCATAASFGRWAGIPTAQARATWACLKAELTPVRTPLGHAWMLARDERSLREPAGPAAPARLLPSGDSYFLLWDEDRSLLLPDTRQRAALWTPRVWPGALLINGEIAGTWRRSAGEVSIEPWRRLTPAERQAVEAEALSLPLPDSPITLHLA